MGAHCSGFDERAELVAVSEGSGSEVECPVTGAKGAVCPAVSFPVVLGSSVNNQDNGKHMEKIKVETLQDVAEPKPSQTTKKELECCRGWPQVRGLSEEDIVTVKGAWNRTTAWKDMLMEAALYRWINLCPEVYDIIKVKFSEVPHDLFTVIDKSARLLDARTEVHHRESYTAGFPACVQRDFGDTPSEILFHYTILGVRPTHWCALKDALLFAMRTQNPYMYQDHDGQDLDKGPDGAVARFFHSSVVGKAHGVFLKHVDTLMSKASHAMHRQALELEKYPEFGQEFYKNLLTRYPDLTDYFANTNMDSMAAHLHSMLLVVGSQGVQLLDTIAALRNLGSKHRVAMVPVSAYEQVGETVMQTVSEFFELEEAVKNSWVYAFMTAATAISAPMAVEERLMLEAREFFEVLAKEQEWGPARLEARMQQVGSEIGLTGTYAHTAEEIQLGARMAWRNSPKCIGRIAWDTLLIRDRRHVTNPQGIQQECIEHLKIGANGGVVQSLMTVFAPRKPSEKWGMRFWNSQFVRYAGYRQKDGGVLGDPANVEFTEMCMNKMGWKPPQPRTQFDPLPQIIQAADGFPFMFELPRELFCEIPLSHPRYPKFAKLGLKWTSLPCITAFNFRLGGVDYPCCPFNGWFVDLEIARNLIERYGLGPQVAKACDFDTSTDSSGWRAMVLQATAAAVTHSFQKRGFSIVDHYSVSKQFLTHVDREKRCGREVPGQWSWIGGFAGVHCPVWGYEMRDFYLRPQYHYCCERWVVDDVAGSANDATVITASADSVSFDAYLSVLILFSSTTGTSERFARTLASEVGSGYRPRVMDLGSFNKEVASRFTHILCCVSTFADGDAPLNGAGFPVELPFKLVNRRTNKPIRYAVMALGSTIYPKFCAFGKKVDKALSNAGGVAFVQTVLSDETKGHDASFAKFKAAVRVELPAKPPPEGMKEPELKVTLVKGPDCKDTTRELPLDIRGHTKAAVVGSHAVFDDKVEERSTRIIQIDISGCSGMTYTTGGHLSVLPHNPHEEIMRLCEQMEISKEKMHWKLDAVMDDGLDKYAVDLGFNNVSLYETLKWHLDISVRPATLATILGLVKSAGGMTQEEYNELMTDKRASVARFWWVSNVLKAYPKFKGKISISSLVTSLGKQFPRLYSISSSCIVSPTVVELAVSLVCVQHHRGLASGFLHGMQPGSPIWIASRDSSFRLPSETSAPLIMVGAGTGVAPFLAFAQERMRLLREDGNQPGSAMLFAGFRRKVEAIQPEVFSKAIETNALTKNSMSLTREPGLERETIADALRKAAEQVLEALKDPNCHYYCCGDGSMADSAYDALLSTLVASGHISRVMAVKQIEKMHLEGRYHLDVWGTVSQFKTLDKAKHQRQTNLAKKWLADIQDVPVEDAD